MQINSQYIDQLKSFIERLSDLRFAGQVVFVVIVLLISWSGIKTIQTNYGLQRQISALRQQNDLQKLENNNLELQNEYYKSDQFLELSARQNFGLAASGEKVLVVPKNVAMSYTTGVQSDAGQSSESKKSGVQRHFQSWYDFFLHRQGD